MLELTVSTKHCCATANDLIDLIWKVGPDQFGLNGFAKQKDERKAKTVVAGYR